MTYAVHHLALFGWACGAGGFLIGWVMRKTVFEEIDCVEQRSPVQPHE